jgi:hypothetical protein
MFIKAMRFYSTSITKSKLGGVWREPKSVSFNSFSTTEKRGSCRFDEICDKRHKNSHVKREKPRLQEGAIRALQDDRPALATNKLRSVIFPALLLHPAAISNEAIIDE